MLTSLVFRSLLSHGAPCGRSFPGLPRANRVILSDNTDVLISLPHTLRCLVTSTRPTSGLPPFGGKLDVVRCFHTLRHPRPLCHEVLALWISHIRSLYWARTIQLSIDPNGIAFLPWRRGQIYSCVLSKMSRCIPPFNFVI